MKQVVLNLIVNAVQAMPTGGILTISLKAEQGQTLGTPAIRLTISDSGIGIEPAHRSRIFDPFFSTKDEGTGLGLAIVYAIVEAHQGRIDVESIVGQGTSFAILLPHPSAPRLLSDARGSERAQLEQTEDTSDDLTDLVLAEEPSHE